MPDPWGWVEQVYSYPERNTDSIKHLYGAWSVSATPLTALKKSHYTNGSLMLLLTGIVWFHGNYRGIKNNYSPIFKPLRSSLGFITWRLWHLGTAAHTVGGHLCSKTVATWKFWGSGVRTTQDTQGHCLSGVNLEFSLPDSINPFYPHGVSGWCSKQLGYLARALTMSFIFY